MSEAEARAAAQRFFSVTARTQVRPLGAGHIHQTWLAEASGESPLVLQRLNQEVFPDLDSVIANIECVSLHLREKYRNQPDAERRAARLVVDRAGDAISWHAGAAWRAFEFIANTQTHQTVTNIEVARETGRAFGRFAFDLSDLDPGELAVPLPRFHDLPHRHDQLVEAVQNDLHARAATCSAEIEQFQKAAARLQSELGQLGADALPTRIVHNDCKLNNLLFDNATERALCVVDLDTVMPGKLLHDFGDLARTATCPQPEDSLDLGRVAANPEWLIAISDAYAHATEPVLTPLERAIMPLAGPMITLETGLRFLADHLNGDRYFPARRAQQNLARARVQLRLFASLESLREAVRNSFAA